MPSKTTSYSEKDYQYIMDTKRTNQGFSDRVRELIRKAKKVERESPCIPGYIQDGTTTKDGETVPNCVPVEEYDE